MRADSFQNIMNKTNNKDKIIDLEWYNVLHEYYLPDRIQIEFAECNYF